jgi:hypothetical protein
MQAALTTHYRNGVAEGHINRLKISRGKCMVAPASHCFASVSCMAISRRGSPHKVRKSQFSVGLNTLRNEWQLMAGFSQLSVAPECLVTDRRDDTIETQLWLEEHDWLYALLKSEENVAPTFRLLDLISACVSLVFAEQNAVERLFAFLGTDLVLRAPHGPRRREAMWMPQYALLLVVQRSPANLHPQPKFQLDQFTTACVALSRQADPAGANVLRQARMNMAERICKRKEAHPTG